jgi:CRISPR type III-associated protein (TIGR04423 family)
MMTKIENLNGIKDRLYEGYIWGSNGIKKPDDKYEKLPHVLKGEKFDSSFWEADNPHIVEGWLVHKSETEHISVYIKHTGTYQVYEYDLKNLPEGSETRSVKYLQHRLEGIDKVNFQQLWIPEEEENCENMPVLKMKALIFTGFTHLKNKDDVS